MSIKFILISISLIGSCFGQILGEQDFIRLTQVNGLSHNKISGIAQDSLGYIWISTAKGLNRFDGKKFLHFYADSTNNSLPQDEIRQCRLLRNNVIAASTSTGLFCINTHTLKSFSLIIPAGKLKHQYKVNAIMDFTDDDAGNYYLLTRSGFYAFNKDGKLWFRYDAYEPHEVENIVFAYGYSLAEIAPGEILLSTRDGVMIFSGKKLKSLSSAGHTWLNLIRPNKPRILHKNNHQFIIMEDSTTIFKVFDLRKKKMEIIESSLYRDQFNWRSSIFKLNDRLYAATHINTGFNIIRVMNDKFFFSPHTYFRSERCNALLTDKQGRLWIGTDNGLYYQKNNSGFIEQLTFSSKGSTSDFPPGYRMVTLANGKIFASTNGQGMHIFSRGTATPLKKIDFDRISSSAGRSLSCINLDNDTVIAGNISALVYINTNDLNYSVARLPEWDTTFWVTSLFRDTKGNIYVGKNEEGFIYTRPAGSSRYFLEDHRKNQFYKILVSRHIAEDNEGNIWFCGHGLSRYNIQKRTFDFKLDSFPAIRISRKETTGLTFDKNGKMYFGVAENGLLIYDPLSKSYRQFTRNEGLPDNNVLALHLLGNYLWIATESAISRLDLSNEQIETFHMNGILTEDPFTGFSFYYDSSANHLYAPLNNSILRFQPNNINSNSNPPDFFVADVEVNNRDHYYQPSSIKLPFNKNNLIVNLAAINFEDSWQHQYYYRFASDENLHTWQFAGDQTSFNFINLQPGEHSLQFMLRSKNNNWPEKIIDLSITINPPFWKTLWFIMLVSLVGILLVYIIYRSRIRSVRKQANMDKHLAELEIKGLHAQMNPHFIFNALNSIKEMILMNEKANASRYLSKFAQLIRLSLEQSRQTFISVKQCIQHLEQYLEMEQIRFENFTYKITIDENININEVKMAPMLLQPLVENAVWHGLKEIREDKLLQIRLYTDKQQLVCEVEDNGPGLLHNHKNSTHNSIGIANIHERLLLLNEKYKMNCSLHLINKSDQDIRTHGTIAILRLTI